MGSLQVAVNVFLVKISISSYSVSRTLKAHNYTLFEANRSF